MRTRWAIMGILPSIMYNFIANTAVKISLKSGKYFLSYCLKQNSTVFIDAHCILIDKGPGELQDR